MSEEKFKNIPLGTKAAIHNMVQKAGIDEYTKAIITQSPFSNEEKEYAHYYLNQQIAKKDKMQKQTPEYKQIQDEQKQKDKELEQSTKEQNMIFIKQNIRANYPKLTYAVLTAKGTLNMDNYTLEELQYLANYNNNDTIKDEEDKIYQKRIEGKITTEEAKKRRKNLLKRRKKRFLKELQNKQLRKTSMDYNEMKGKTL